MFSLPTVNQLETDCIAFSDSSQTENPPATYPNRWRAEMRPVPNAMYILGTPPGNASQLFLLHEPGDCFSPNSCHEHPNNRSQFSNIVLLCCEPEDERERYHQDRSPEDGPDWMVSVFHCWLLSANSLSSLRNLVLNASTSTPFSLTGHPRCFQ